MQKGRPVGCPAKRTVYLAIQHARQEAPLAGVFLLQGLIFLLDLSLPQGISAWMLYLIPLWLSAGNLEQARMRVLITKSTSTVLIALGYLWAPPGIPSWIAAGSRAMGVMIGWLLAIGLLRAANQQCERRRMEQEIRRLLHETQQREDELRTKQQQLIQAAKLASIGELASGVAHELNNPLNNIGLFAGNLLDSFKYGQGHRARNSVIEDLEMIQREVRKAAEIINHLRTFSRSAGSVKRPVHIHAIIHTALRLMQEQLRLSDITVCLQLTGESPTVLGNEIQLEQVFINLLTNARDAMKEMANRRLVIASHTQGGDVTIVVEDTGGGIAPENLPRIFDPFFTTKEPGHGTGLGLSISYGIITEHQGTIAVESQLNKGTRFVIQLPLAPGQHAALPRSPSNRIASLAAP